MFRQLTKTNDTPPTTSHVNVDHLELYRKFSDTEAAESIRGKSRFSKYRPQHVNSAQWIELLGAHADMLRQAEATYTDATEFVGTLPEDIDINKEERDLLLSAAATYNWGKSATGDVAYEQKTSNEEDKEKQAWRRLYSQLVNNDKKVLSLLETTIFDNDSKTGKAFSAIKRMGYIKTSLRALEAGNTVEDPVLAGHLKWLAAGVLSNQIHLILEYSRLYPNFKTWLDSQRPGINKLFAETGPEIFAQHGQGENQYRELYLRSKSDWEALAKPGTRALIAEIEKTLNSSALAGIDPKVLSKLKDSVHLLANTGQASANRRETYDNGIFGQGSNFESRFIADWDQLDRTIHALRDILGLKIVLTSGTFDIKHLGHDKYLERASEQGDILVVGVDNDEKVRYKKGPNRPVVDERQRLEELVHARGVGIVTLKPLAEEKWQLIKLIRPDTLVVTTEHYYRFTPEELSELKQYVGRIVALPPQSESSTTARIRRLHVDFSKKLQEEIPNLINKLINDA